MEQLLSEVLLNTFRKLNSKEMVGAMLVCRRWSGVIGSTRNLWRSLVIPEQIVGEIEILDIFDAQSRSSLVEVDMMLNLKENEASLYMEILNRSQETLETLWLSSNNPRVHPILFDSLWKFPHLVDCRIFLGSTWQPVRIKDSKHRDQGSRTCSPSLKILWVGPMKSFPNQNHFLSNLSSLKMFSSLRSSDLRRILEIPSNTLKHLDLQIERSGADNLPPLNFPKLQALYFFSGNYEFLTWLKIPTSSTVIVQLSYHLPSMPSISTLWTSQDSSIGHLANRCPVLTTLKITEVLSVNVDEVLLKMLRQRRKNSDSKFEVDGVKMAPIQTLIIPFQKYDPDTVVQLRTLVEELVDLQTVPEFLEVEI